MDTLHAIIGRSSIELPWWQLSIRAVVIFFFGLVLIRLFGRRAFGKQSPLDIVIAIVIGSNLSRALTGNAPLIPTLIATAIIVMLFWVMEHLAARSGMIAFIVKGRPIPLMKDRGLSEEMMKRVAVSRGDIEEAARQSGIFELSRVDHAVLEPSGKISTLRAQSGS